VCGFEQSCANFSPWRPSVEPTGSAADDVVHSEVFVLPRRPHIDLSCDGDVSGRPAYFSLTLLSHTIETSYVILRDMKTVVGRNSLMGSLDKMAAKKYVPAATGVRTDI
jgi:hypothetical protein